MGPEVPVTQINLHHSKCASAILARSMAAMQTDIALIQEPWLLKDAIKGLSSCGKICYTHSNCKTRTYIAVKGLNVTFMPQLSCEDLTVVQIRLDFSMEVSLDVLVGSAYMPYDSEDLPFQDEVKNLIAYAEKRGLELLLGCNANSHHALGEGVWASTPGERAYTIHYEHQPHDSQQRYRIYQDSRRQKVIDITLCMERVAGLVTNWIVSNEPSGSDHRFAYLSVTYRYINERDIRGEPIGKA
ncbi:uncharacterized protein LOC114943457 [Nylanderia fulva]|uniref:uncharacterized protein LOC114943457 n=1 Tax=Nylanderia fulva TaxID=613905 RepID=UPI0010FADDB2|nr:uncharacterized protein LOC114943457 [Nylanderia fulva]